MGGLPKTGCTLLSRSSQSQAVARWLAITDMCGHRLRVRAFLDNCRVYRAALKRQRGQPSEARQELEEAARSLAEGPGVLVAGACVLRAGRDPPASRRGRCRRTGLPPSSIARASAQPGLTLLRFRQGDTPTAAKGLRRALAEAARPQERGRLLPALVTVSVAGGAFEEAERAVIELEHQHG